MLEIGDKTRTFIAFVKFHFMNLRTTGQNVTTRTDGDVCYQVFISLGNACRVSKICRVFPQAPA